MANYIQDKEKEGNIKILLVVAENAHKDNWKKEIIKWGLKSNDITIECYASLSKYKESWWDLIIFDEAHHCGAPLSSGPKLFMRSYKISQAVSISS